MAANMATVTQIWPRNSVQEPVINFRITKNTYMFITEHGSELPALKYN